MQRLTVFFLCCWAVAARAQDCNIPGNTVIYDYREQRWTFTDSADALKTSLPASTFKVINLLIALETGVIKDEMAIVKWPGYTDTTLYGYRPSIYKDMTVKEAFEVSAGWVFMELSKKIGKERYRHYLAACQYGNGNLSRNDPDFWNYGPFEISPRNQVEFLIKVYEEKLPFSKRSFEILKRVMVTERTDNYVIRSKTGWTRVYGNDYGWWVGYLEKKDNVYFFATRLVKDRKVINPDFSSCRKQITIQKLKELKAM
ncbi:penicillin-binding transpeptidase domain-containing protein [Chitinophaga sp.]|uniref:penicillin-binding transpeptidase domain-containing protein n=1 Tax=Chitinophaga sp. TaxID=1869181 RepID=UPI0031E18D15